MFRSMPLWLAMVLLALVIPWAWIAGRNSRRWLIMRLKDRADKARRERKKVEQELARLRAEAEAAGG